MTSPASRPRGLTLDPRSLLSYALLVAVAGFGAWLIGTSGAEVARAAHRVGITSFAVSGVLGVVGNLCMSGIWVALLHGAGVRPRPSEAMAAFFVTQLGKYLPGAVWPVVAQMEWGRRWGTSRRSMVAVNLLLVSMLTTTGLLVGVATLPWSSSAGLSRYGWTLLALVPLLASLHPRAIPAMLDAALRVTNREPLGMRLAWRSMILALLWCLGLWVCMGLHLLVMTRSLGAGSVSDWAAATGAIALGLAVGLIVIPAPAGAGIREAVLVATLAPAIGTSGALTVALASRVLLLLADVALAGVSAIWKIRRPSSTTTSDPGTATWG